MISSVGFVPLGALKSEPIPLEITEADLKELKNRVQEVQGQSDSILEDSDADEEMIVEDDPKEIAVKTAKEIAKRSSEFELDPESNEMMRELKLDEYDSEEDIAGTSCLDNIVSSLPVEYSIRKDEEIEEETSEELSSSEEDQVEIENTDVVILATKADEFLSSIEIWLYEEADDASDGNLIVHHDIPLACYPLCCEYLDIQPGGGLKQCNMIAIGGMKTDIEIYDLDILDPISPITTLTLSTKKSKISTCALSSNEKYRNILAAGCDDKRVRIWDLAQGVMTSEIKLHKSCIQSIGWNPSEHSVLLTGSHDKKCCLIDVRSADAEALKWKLRGENEAISWCPNHSTCFLASDETGEVVMFDARKGSHSDSIFQLEAHKENTTVLCFSPLNPVLFMTGSEDGKVKIWDMSDQTSPGLIEKQNFSVGEILAGGFCKYAGHLCIAAGEQGNLKVWDTRASKSVRNHYTSEVYIPEIFRPKNDL